MPSLSHLLLASLDFFLKLFILRYEAVEILLESFGAGYFSIVELFDSEVVLSHCNKLNLALFLFRDKNGQLIVELGDRAVGFIFPDVEGEDVVFSVHELGFHVEVSVADTLRQLGVFDLELYKGLLYLELLLFGVDEVLLDACLGPDNIIILIFHLRQFLHELVLLALSLHEVDVCVYELFVSLVEL